MKVSDARDRARKRAPTERVGREGEEEKRIVPIKSSVFALLSIQGVSAKRS